MRTDDFIVTENSRLAPDVFGITLETDGTPDVKPGQFVNLRLEGLFLRRPISVFDAGEGILRLIYKVVGTGTEILSRAGCGHRINVMYPLGNGYDLSRSGNMPLLIGGGVGIPPLYFLAKGLKAEGKSCKVILGFNKESEVFCYDDFLELGCDVSITTADGSRGVKGFATDAMPDDYTYYYACGPLQMLKAVYSRASSCGLEGQLSLEERMGCGFGACMGCTIKTHGGYKRVCKDGPVFESRELIW